MIEILTIIGAIILGIVTILGVALAGIYLVYSKLFGMIMKESR